MLNKIENLPHGILGMTAEGKVTKDDYERILIPLLEEQYRVGKRIRFLYQFGPEFSGFTASAAMDDFRVGMKYLRLFERCAIVTDKEWILAATHLAGSFMPCPVKTFKNNELSNAVEWLSSVDADSSLKFELRNDGILILRPQGVFKREDFDKIAEIIDPWIETHKQLKGLVVSIQKFPGWENFGSFIHHLQFVNAHQRKVRRVALAVDGVLPEMMGAFAHHFVEAEVKQFSFEQTEEAIAWANT